MEDSLPHFKSFCRSLNLKPSIRQQLVRFMLSILVREGRNSAMHAAGALVEAPVHRAQPSRFLGRVGWRALNILGQLVMLLLKNESWAGRYILILDSTMVGHQGTTIENTYSTGNRQRRPKKNRRYKKYKYAYKSCHCFVFGLLITPQGTRLPFVKPVYTKQFAAREKKKRYTQAQLGAQIIRSLPVPANIEVVVLGDTAFDAKTIREACAARGYHWICPVNANRVFAGQRGQRPRVSSRINQLSTTHLTSIRLSQTGGRYAKQRRLSHHRSKAKQKTRTYYVHSEMREVHSVGHVLLVFSTTRINKKKLVRDSTRVLMTNATNWTAREVVELYCLRWQIELFFKELKSILGMHQYRFQKFDKVEAWIEIVLITFVYLEWTRERKLTDRRLTPDQRQRWQPQRCYGIRQAILVGIQLHKFRWLQKRLKSKNGLKTIAKKLTQLLAQEYRCAA